MTVFLAVAALLLGTVVLHSGLEQHNGLEGATRVFLTGGAPATGPELQAATALELPICPACVLQLQSLGALGMAPRQPVGWVRSGDALAAVPPAVSVASPRRAPARGSPLV